MAPKTVAIIMDGNGRWAKKRGLPRTAGHKKGADTIRTVALAAQDMGIQKLILYAFSTENWKRPEDEVSYLCKLPGLFFNKFINELMEKNIRVTFAGELEKFPQTTQNVINKAVNMTKDNTGLELCLAINYGSRREMLLGMKAGMKSFAESANWHRMLLTANVLRQRLMNLYWKITLIQPEFQTRIC